MPAAAPPAARARAAFTINDPVILSRSKMSSTEQIHCNGGQGGRVNLWKIRLPAQRLTRGD
jgi:hypothetical protein